MLVPDDPDAAPVPLDGERPVGFASADSPLAGAVRRAARRRPGPARLLVPYGGRLYELRLARRPSATAVVCRTVARPSALTARELEVLAELAEGRTNPEIAERLCVARRTVATHVEHILVKLGVPNRVAAAARAVAWGLEPAP
ncbi:response regulator transcription factor [Streptomyces sp. C8S0]|uniref:response regulator transcription factor n=1 Tax=Streptomyces sp. C8S0 TaxID=2585716 RepID=UPI001D03BA11|nr:helix-turn-helix transcriptional regulator [Streptomyces sp. C8S0]